MKFLGFQWFGHVEITLLRWRISYCIWLFLQVRKSTVPTRFPEFFSNIFLIWSVLLWSIYRVTQEAASFFFFFFFYFTILYWFCHTSTWIRHGCTHVPKPEPPSHLPPRTIPLGHPSAPAPSSCILHRTCGARMWGDCATGPGCCASCFVTWAMWPSRCSGPWSVGR